MFKEDNVTIGLAFFTLFLCIILGVTLSPIFMIFALIPFGYLVNTEYERRLGYKNAIQDDNDLDNLKGSGK